MTMRLKASELIRRPKVALLSSLTLLFEHALFARHLFLCIIASELARAILVHSCKFWAHNTRSDTRYSQPVHGQCNDDDELSIRRALSWSSKSVRFIFTCVCVCECQRCCSSVCARAKPPILRLQVENLPKVCSHTRARTHALNSNKLSVTPLTWQIMRPPHESKRAHVIDIARQCDDDAPRETDLSALCGPLLNSRARTMAGHRT